MKIVVDVITDGSIVAVLLVGKHGVVDFDSFQGLGNQTFQIAQIAVSMIVDLVGIAGDETGHELFYRTDIIPDIR